MEIPIGQLPEPERLRPKGIADLVICIDSTGSMSNCIEGVKTHIQELLAGFEANADIKLDWRVRLIEYRDLNCGEATVEYAFTRDIEEFRGQVRNVRARGGGDEPESTLDAIFTALRSDWRHSCNKCVVVFTDATTHPHMHADTVEPGQARDVDEVINKIYETRARLFIFAPRCAAYESLAEAERVEYEVVEGAGLTGVDFAKVLKTLGKTVSASTDPTPLPF